MAATHPGLLGSVHGGGVYAEVVFKKLLQQSPLNTVDVFFWKHKHLSESIEQLCLEYQVVQHKISYIEDLQDLIDGGDFHTLYSALPYSLYRPINTSNIRFVYTIHGLRELEVPYSTDQWRYSYNWKRIIEWGWGMLFTKHFLESSKKRIGNLLQKPNSIVVTVSNHSKYSLLSFFHSMIKSENIRVLYSPLLESEAAPAPSEQNIEPYFLIINGNRWIKNSRRALIALQRFYRKNPKCTVKTVVLGCATPLRRFANDPMFIFKGYVSRDELESCYKNAFTFIYPTLNEGFGYPPLEAMKYGTPVLASACSSVMEVCANAVSYFNPYDLNEIENRITEIFYDKEKRGLLKQLGKCRFAEIKYKQSEMLESLCHLIKDHKNTI